MSAPKLPWAYTVESEKRFNPKTGEPEKASAWHNIRDPEGTLVAGVYTSALFDSTPIKTAYVIAAAPELFQALNDVDSAITALDPEDKSTLANLQAAQERARAILKKAAGG